MDKKCSYYSLANLPKTIASPCGSKIYEWSYLDKVGNLKTDKKNVYEEIQSYKGQCDYKKRIKEGEDLSDNGNGLFLDCTKFSGDYGDVNEYLASLADTIRSQLQTIDNGTTMPETSEIVKESAVDKSASGSIEQPDKQSDTSNKGDNIK